MEVAYFRWELLCCLTMPGLRKDIRRHILFQMRLEEKVKP